MPQLSPFAPPFAFADVRPALPVTRLLRLCAVLVPLFATITPLAVYVPAIYARDFGLPLATIGVIFLAGQVFNSVLDPLAGALSDRIASRWGRRRPWIAAGAVPFFSGAAMVYFPPAHVSPVWLISALALIYIGWAAIQTPFFAWAGEISGDYHERTRIMTWTTVVTAVTLFATLVLPTIADQLRPRDGHLQLMLMGGLALTTALPALLVTLTALPEQPAAIAQRFSLREALTAVFANGLLLRVLASDTAVRTGQGIRAVLMVFFIGVYMQRPQWAAGLFLFQFVFGIVAGPIWGAIGRRIGKHRAAVTGELLQTAINLGLLLATPDRFGLVLALALAQGLTQGSGNLMLRAMVADIADARRADSGTDHTGLYFSVFSLSEKLGGALAVGIALPLVGWLGFQARGANTPAALDGLLLVFALGPAIAHAVSAALLAHFPLDERAHREIRARLDDEALALAPAE
jgi:Na+/melibiose symporter-like transporter